MADSDEPQRPITPQQRVAARLTAAAAAEAAAQAAARRTAKAVRPIPTGLALFAAALVICMIAYLAFAVPGPWFPRASPVKWPAANVALTRGTGNLAGGVLVITGVDAAETALISLTTDIRSMDYRALQWDAADVPPNADVRMLWRSDYAQQKMNSVPVTVVGGRLAPVTLAGEPAWVGRISGIALVIHAPLTQPILFRGATAKPLGVLDVLRDRAREWLAFERWNGVSINVVPGGAGIQDLPLPPLLAVAVLLATLMSLLRLRFTPRFGALPLAIGAIFTAAWFVADMRWQATLVRQVLATSEQYGGRDWRDRHLAAEDGVLFQFIENVRAKLPATPTRVFMIAEANYFRDRGAYHLYPHNVYFDPYQDTLPPAGVYRPGDYLVVFQRRGIQYDAAQKRLRLVNGTTVAAEVILADRGAALLRVL